LDIIIVRTVQFAFKGELAIVINDHGEAVTIEVVVLEANKAVVFEVRTHHRVAVVFFNYT
jgi:ribosomal protein L21E